MAERYTTCIVGAGISGLNALFVASRYLRDDQTVALIDRRPRAGGMWLDTYEHVRLHQPHPFFTVGNMEWLPGLEPEHLASKQEVVDHLQYCLEVLKQRLSVIELFGHEFEYCEELGSEVHVRCRTLDGCAVDLRAGNLVKAFGQNVPRNRPLRLSSSGVHSVSPDFFDLRGPELRASKSPVWIVGGGKSGLDAAHALITDQPAREINLLAGPGTLFMSRDRLFPRSTRRWWKGSPPSDVFRRMARRFDGTNEDEVVRWFRKHHGIWLTPRTGNFLAAILSESEKQIIEEGLNQIVMDYLVDVIDGKGAPEMRLRSQAAVSLQPGSWIVNCTGSLMRGDHPFEPYVSASGRILSIQNRSATIPFPTGGAAAYFLTHLLFLGKLSQVPLCAMDVEDLRRKAPQIAMCLGLGALQFYNLSLIADALSTRQLMKVFGENGLDMDRWYPLPRRLRSAAAFMLSHRLDRRRHRRTLDTIGRRFGVRCGPEVGADQR